MTRVKYTAMLEGLAATIREMALVGGQDDRVRELVDLVDELQEFWNGVDAILNNEEDFDKSK